MYASVRKYTVDADRVGEFMHRADETFAARLEHKAAGRLEKVAPAFTSWRCSECGTVDRKARESQAVFRCRSCGYSANADLNAARNIAAGHAARGGQGLPRPSNHEPQLPTFHVA